MTVATQVMFLCLLCSIKTSVSIRLHQVTQPVDHAEEPTWDSRKNVLYFVDIHSGGILSYEYATKKVHSIHLKGDVTPLIPSKHDPNLLIVGNNRSVVAVEWDGKSKEYRTNTLNTVSKQFPTSRFNDGKADKQGRLWFGTMGYENSQGELTPNQGLLYKITRENLDNPSVMIAPVNISNGLAWNKNNDKFYYIDTPTRKIVQYDYDDKLGEIKNGQVVFDLSLYNISGNPDGMTIDEDDNLWIALYNGGAIIKVDPKTSHLLQIVAIPAQAVTSAMWGGPKLDILYITTSRYTLTPEERLEQPYAGSVFALTDTGTRGRKVFEADIIDSI